MKRDFEAFYIPQGVAMDELWNNSLFVVDANVLLNLYRYSTDTKNTFLNLIQKLSTRFWIPHQVALEYHSNRIGVIYEQSDAYKEVINSISNASSALFSKLEEDLKNYKKRHPVIDVNSINNRIGSFINELNNELGEQEKNHPNYVYEDGIRDLLDKCFKENVGGAYSQIEMDALFLEGADRYSRKFPPGYKDLKDKTGKVKYHNDLVIKSEYGDLIVWKQILDKAKAEEKPIIFVTDDTKEDWWLREKGKTVGPRPEIMNEFRFVTGQDFYMYESHKFIEYAQKYLNEQVNNDAVQEVQDFIKAKAQHSKQTNDRLVELFINISEKEKKNLELQKFYEMINHKIPAKFVAGDILKDEKRGIGQVMKTRYLKDKEKYLLYVKFVEQDQLVKIYDDRPYIKKLFNDFENEDEN